MPSALANTPPSDSLISWFPLVTVDLSFWHGGKKLKDLERFEWPGEVVMAPALEQARKNCDFYGIEQASSLEVWAFRADWLVAKTLSEVDLHWASLDPDPQRRHKALIRHQPVWSSKRGHLAPLDQWSAYVARFTKFVPVKTTLSPGEDLSKHLSAWAEEPSLMASQAGLAIVDGRVSDLQVLQRSDKPLLNGYVLMMVSGSVTIALSPHAGPRSDRHVEQLLSGAMDVQLLGPTGRVELDHTVVRPTMWDVSRIKSHINS